jgi:preprotein translocase subunit SecA
MLSLEEQGKVPPVDEDFYPCTVPAAIEDRLDEAVDALAQSEAAGEYGTFLALEELVATLAGEAPFEPGPTFELLVELREAFSSLKNLFKETLAAEKQRVVEAGGLYVLGTTRHESRRIDNQLRGRAGRQGDPGTTRFFISLQDDVFRIFGGEKIEGLMDRFKLGDKIPLQSPIVNDTLNRVQTAVEEFFKRTRTTLFEFDKVISKQRELTYQVRRNFLAADDVKVRELIEQWGTDSVQIHMAKAAEMSHEEKATEFKEYYGFDMPSIGEYSKLEEEDQEFPSSIVETLGASVQEGISRKWDEYEQFRPGFPIEAARIATIVTIDDEWKDLLQKMDALKQTVGLAAYKGRNPLKEYQVQGFRMYEKCADNFKARSVSRWLRSKPKKQ